MTLGTVELLTVFLNFLTFLKNTFLKTTFPVSVIFGLLYQNFSYSLLVEFNCLLSLSFFKKSRHALISSVFRFLCRVAIASVNCESENAP